jgi:hypothetical protein
MHMHSKCNGSLVVRTMTWCSAVTEKIKSPTRYHMVLCMDRSAMIHGCGYCVGYKSLLPVRDFPGNRSFAKSSGFLM